MDELVLFLCDGAVIDGVTILDLGSILDSFHLAGSVVYLLWRDMFELFEGLLYIVLHAEENFSFGVIPIEVDTDVFLSIPVYLYRVLFSETFEEVVYLCFVNILDCEVIYH